MNPRIPLLLIFSIFAPHARPAEKAAIPQARFVLAAQTQSSPVAPGQGAAMPQQGDSLSRLLTRQDLGITAMLLGLALAFGFGAMHALSPGHGKTIVAAYLVGSRGNLSHALFLGGMVTFTHTISVFLLGLGTLFLSKYVVPDKIYPVLGTLSGLTIVVIGASLFYQRLKRLAVPAPRHHHHEDDHELAHAHAHSAHQHDHPHDHPHPHDHHHGHDHDHAHHHGPSGHSHTIEGEVTMAGLVGLAVSGGLVPCPSALVLLLSSIAIGRAGLGLLLLVSFSLGLALVLIAIGCAVLYAKDLLPGAPKVAGSPFFRMLPVMSAAVITVVGLVMTAAALGLIKTVI
ncbi:MAG: high frequency lysogenization protein HflD [Bryobacterales bacterium]|nr:high frequency lysogenization protein HflD [Bryobacterales bacterium]